VITTVIFK